MGKPESESFSKWKGTAILPLGACGTVHSKVLRERRSFEIFRIDFVDIMHLFLAPIIQWPVIVLDLQPVENDSRQEYEQ